MTTAFDRFFKHMLTAPAGSGSHRFVQRLPLLTEEEMVPAFAVSTEDVRWIATLQMLEEEIAECYTAAQQSIGNERISVSEVVAAQHLERLRDKFIGLRERAIAAKAE